MSWQRPYSDLRASDAERERVVAFLREQTLLGRLTSEELEERVGLAYASVTVGDLERLIGDLPRRSHPAPRPQRAPQQRRQPQVALLLAGALLLGLPILVATAVALAVVAVFAVGFVLGPFVLVALILVAALRRNGRRTPPPPMRWGRTA